VGAGGVEVAGQSWPVAGYTWITVFFLSLTTPEKEKTPQGKARRMKKCKKRRRKLRNISSTKRRETLQNWRGRRGPTSQDSKKNGEKSMARGFVTGSKGKGRTGQPSSAPGDRMD